MKKSTLNKVLLLGWFILVYPLWTIHAQPVPDIPPIHIEIGEIVVFQPYPFNSHKEEKTYQKLEEDIRVVYPVLGIVKTEYERVNKELALYEGDRQKQYLKWYENYAKKSYMHHLSVMNYRQGRLFLKLISRELETTPFELIKEYRNGFTAVVWQFAANAHFASLNAKYDKDENPMIEHILKRLDAEYQ